jgi:hypothetical protein
MAGLIFVIAYLLVFLGGLMCAGIHLLSGTLPDWAESIRILISAMIVGGIGGCTYCLRAVYLNKCVFNRWNNDWLTWYFVRPIVSCICGGVSYIFLKTGLILLESGPQQNASDLGFYALAFVSGLNVDKFIGKIEDIAQAVWGIEKTGSYERKANEKQDNQP